MYRVTTPIPPEHERAVHLARTADDRHWFDTLYAEADQGSAAVPWDHDYANPRLERVLGPGSGKALVVGCGYGRDAGYLHSLGYEVTGFDLSPTAVRTAASRYPAATFTAADVLHPPTEWNQAFDLVVEAYTIQVLRGADRVAAAHRIADFVAPGGTLLVIAFAARPDDEPPRIAQPLTRAEIESFTHNGLTLVEVDERPPSEEEPPPRWHYVARFTRDQGSSRTQG